MKPRDLLLGLLIWIAAAGTSQAAIPDAPLERWLADTATPELAHRLASHPRLAGASLQVGTLPEHQGNQPDVLSQAVAQRLASLLRSQPGVRLDSTANSCAAADGILLLVDIQDLGSRRFSVDLAFLDPGSGHWLGGLGSQWQGSLTSAARKDLQAPAAVAADGSQARPMPAGDYNGIASAMRQQLACTLARPHPWGSNIRLPGRGDPQLLGALHRELGNLPAVSTTANQGASLRLVQDTADVLTLTISPDSSSTGAVEIARVWLTSPALQQRRPVARPPLTPAPAATLATTAPTAASRPSPATAPDSLIKSLTLAASSSTSGVCRNLGAAGRCLNVTLTLNQPGYALMAWSQGRPDQRSISSLGCGQGQKRAKSRQLRLADQGQLLGIYVLATSDPKVAQAMADVLADAPGACNGRPDEHSQPGASLAWLQMFQRTLAAHSTSLEWRLLHSGVPGSLLAEY